VKIGRAYIACTDHSTSLKIAHGMTREEIEAQALRIEARNGAEAAAGSPFRLLRSIEMDVFSDGSGDMEPEVLAGLDLVLGAFHSKLRDPNDVTDRYLAALANPDVHVLAHPTTRMFGRRRGLIADWPRVFAEAARLGKAIELDATPRRQDLNVELARIAVAEGVRWYSMGSDAHNAAELGHLPIAMATAALAGVPPERILNYRPADEVIAWAAGVRAGEAACRRAASGRCSRSSSPRSRGARAGATSRSGTGSARSSRSATAASSSRAAPTARWGATSPRSSSWWRLGAPDRSSPTGSS
jgi:histidinol phosphatase-like PHP family hydrolase